MRALALVLGAQFFFTLLDATGKALARELGIPLLSLVRHGGQMLLMGLLLAPRLRGTLWRTAHPGLQALRGLAIGLFTLLFFSALARLPQAEATALAFLAPFVVMVAAGPLLGEHVPRVRWLGAALGFGGMLLILRPGNGLDALGVLYALLTVVCSAVFQVLTRRLATLENSLTTVFLSALLGTAVSLAALPWQAQWGGWPARLDAQHCALMGSLAVTGMLGQWMWIRAYYWSSASFVAPLTFLQLVLAVLAGWSLFGQFPDPATLVGILIIVVAGALSMRAR
jgi:drug/metabolite transporter (DMT)-like permease